MAWAAPCPRFGVIGCAASPSKTTRPECHRTIGSRSQMSVRMMRSAGVAAMMAAIGSCHDLKRAISSRCTSPSRPSGDASATANQ